MYGDSRAVAAGRRGGGGITKGRKESLGSGRWHVLRLEWGRLLHRHTLVKCSNLYFEYVHLVNANCNSTKLLKISSHLREGWGAELNRGRTKKDRLAVTKQPRGCEAQHREYGHQCCSNYVWGQVGPGLAGITL